MCRADFQSGGRHLWRRAVGDISTTTNGATIRYTTDGSTPSETAGTVYSSAVNINANLTLRPSITKRAGRQPDYQWGLRHPVRRANLHARRRATMPSAQTVTISTTTNGATIRYTTDGSTPSEGAGTIYSAPVNITANTTLQAIAYLSAMTNSPLTSGVYTISNQCAAPTFNPLGAVSGCIGHWSFDEGSGSILHDSSGGGNNGTISGATWSSAGRYGNCLYFNGTSSVVTIPEGSWDSAAPKTIIAWYNVDPTAAGLGMVYEHLDENGWVVPGSFGCYDDNEMAFVGYDGDSNEVAVSAPTAGTVYGARSPSRSRPRWQAFIPMGRMSAVPRSTAGRKSPATCISVPVGMCRASTSKDCIDEVSIYDRALVHGNTDDLPEYPTDGLLQFRTIGEHQYHHQWSGHPLHHRRQHPE